MKSRNVIAIGLVFAMGRAAAALAGPVVVAECNRTYSGAGFLNADLDCAGVPGGLTIEEGSLNLRGFALSDVAGGIRCSRSCTIHSDPPGGSLSGIEIEANGTLRLRRLRMAGGGIDAFPRAIISRSVITGGFIDARNAVRLLNSVLSGGGTRGVTALRRIRVIDSQVTGRSIGVNARLEALIVRSVIEDNSSVGVQANRVKIKDSMVANNGTHGVVVGFGGPATVVRSTIRGNGAVGLVAGGESTVAESAITDNGMEGIRIAGGGGIHVSKRSVITRNGTHGILVVGEADEPCVLEIDSSRVHDNATSAECSTSRSCADLASCSAPTVFNVSCDTSYDTSSGFPGSGFGVCSLD